MGGGAGAGGDGEGLGCGWGGEGEKNCGEASSFSIDLIYYQPFKQECFGRYSQATRTAARRAGRTGFGCKPVS